MTQLFSNAIDTTLAEPLTDIGTTATLVSGAGLSLPTGSDFELLVIQDTPLIEIVKVTDRADNVITIERAQEGSTARSWSAGARVFAGVTAETLTWMAAALRNSSVDLEALAIGYRVLTGNQRSVALGVDTSALGENSIAIGRSTVAGATRSMAYGFGADASGIDSVCLGSQTDADGNSSLAAGHSAWASTVFGIAVGYGIEAKDEGTVAIGNWTIADGYRSVSLGYAADTFADGVYRCTALPVVHAWPPANSVAATRNNTPIVTIHSTDLNFKSAQIVTINLPLHVGFFPSEVGIYAMVASGVSAQPTIRFGTDDNFSKYLADTLTTDLVGELDKQSWSSLASEKGARVLRCEITIAGAATGAFSGRIYWRGFAVEEDKFF